MNPWLIKNALPLGLSAVLTGIVAFGLHSVSVAFINASHEREIAKQKTVLTQQCEASKAVTEEVSYEYQKQLAGRDAALADARRLLNRQCAAVVVDTASGHHGSSGAGKSSGSNDGGFRADANELLDIAAEGEKYRLQLIGCQTFIDRARGLNQ